FHSLWDQHCVGLRHDVGLLFFPVVVGGVVRSNMFEGGGGFSCRKRERGKTTRIFFTVSTLTTAAHSNASCVTDAHQVSIHHPAGRRRRPVFVKNVYGGQLYSVQCQGA
ncbi:unnamed protein product, partial [Ectocarpus sp. 12 AP-2014]